MTESSVIQQMKCEEFIAKKAKRQMKYEIWNMKNAAWQMHFDNIINTMSKRKFEECNVENAIKHIQCKKINLTNVM